jgi:hypothetical protein
MFSAHLAVIGDYLRLGFEGRKRRNYPVAAKTGEPRNPRLYQQPIEALRRLCATIFSGWQSGTRAAALLTRLIFA